MKKKLRRSLSILFVLTLLTLIVPLTAFASYAIGDDLSSQQTVLHTGVTLNKNVFWSNSRSALQTEHYVTYSPGLWVTPVVTYGNTVNSRNTLASIVSGQEAQGKRVVAAVNGDFYGMSNGVPMGLVVTEGTLRSASGSYYAVGFQSNGTAILGQPQLQMTLYGPYGEVMAEISALNKVRSADGGVYAFTSDFNDAHTTGNNEAGVDVICSISAGRLAIGDAVVLQVEQVLETDSATQIPEGKVLLSANNGSAVQATQLRSLQPGMILTLSTQASDSRWNSVEYAVGAMYSLIEYGQVVSDLDNNTTAPRTAVGQKSDGSLVFYTIDGRQSNYSRGITMQQLAQRLLELGCTTALCLDGGGSTTLMATYPDSLKAEQINSPSEGKQRSISNQILLLSSINSYGSYPSDIFLSASSSYALPGSTVHLRAGAYDSSYLPVSGSVSLWASAGTLSGNQLTLPDTPGTVTVTGSSGGASRSIQIQVVSPDSISVTADGSEISSLELTAGSSVSLAASALYRHMAVPTDSSSFRWSAEGDAGTLDENGVFTAGLRNGGSIITVSCGETRLTLPVTVSGGVPFVDIEGHWAAADLGKLYLKNILTGEEREGLVYAMPDNKISRQQFAVMLYRYLGLSGDYSDVVLPYADLDQIGEWALPAVRAMYSMGIMTGSEENGNVYLTPTKTVSRSQAATMVGRLLQQELPTQLLFTDAASIPDYALSHVQTLVSLNILSGYDDGSFRPGNSLTRAQAAKIFCRLLELPAAA